MSDLSDELARIRAELEAADAALVEALDARARAVKAMVRLRERDPDGYYVVPRDADVITHARDHAKDFPRDAVEPVFREVLSATAKLVAPTTVVVLGPEGGFAAVAARRNFGASAKLIVADSVPQVIDEVTRGRASFGVVPFETSSEGAITATLHGLAESDVKICGELTVAASYHLLSATGNATDVEKVYGTPQAIAACERHLRMQYPRATLIDVPSGDVAAQLAREDHGAAVVGSDLIAQREGMRVVQEHIEDMHGVQTRFAIVGNDLPPRTGTDRTVLALAVHDNPGALYHALQPFADRGVNLTRLESRPASNTAWRYLFFVELDGHVTDRPILTALEELRGKSRFVKILGSYPRPV